MAPKREKIHFASVDELLGAPVTKDATEEIRIDKIFPFENHPFKVIDDEKMDELVESIQANGVLTPVILRPDDEGTYEMISGHRRMHAAKRAGLTVIPAIIKPMTNDEAVLMMVDSNIQREELLPSEKAFAYKMKLDAMKRQGIRTDLVGKETSAQNERKLESADILGQQVGESRAQVRRLIRLTELIPKFLKMVDEKKLAITIAVEISYYSKEQQEWIAEYMLDYGKVVPAQIMDIRRNVDITELSKENLFRLLCDGKPRPKPQKKLVITEKVLNSFFPKNYTREQKEEVIYELLTKWKE
ncbi:MAG: ParB/RepB/Spo0J family partition protein, partial [Pseudobutyrivibrio sp.]|nr:ParB/RepB/Spo0J family partition protein [Pseudobutyrivibrio sp.]